jgi:transposase-like protein
MYCQIKYTPEPKAWAYDEQMRRKALEMYVDGMNLRRIARHLGLHHRTVSLWVKAQAASLPAAPVPQEMKKAEMDELFTFFGEKKAHLHPHDRRSGDALFYGLQDRLGPHASCDPGPGG